MGRWSIESTRGRRDDVSRDRCTYQPLRLLERNLPGSLKLCLFRTAGASAIAATATWVTVSYFGIAGGERHLGLVHYRRSWDIASGVSERRHFLGLPEHRFWSR